jgi:hypothetical protein
MKQFFKLIVLVLFVVILGGIEGCNKEKWFGGPNFMQEDFEAYAHVDSMFSNDDVRWSYFQNTVDGNYIAFDTNIVHGGNRSLKFFAHASTGDVVSKMSIAKQQMAFYEGDVVRISAWYYIEGNANLDWLFLFDFEEQAAIGAGPGIRLANTEANGMVLEHKFFADDIYQEEGQQIFLPRNQWFNLTMEVKLHQKKNGYVRVWQDNVLILSDDDVKTLPKDFLYNQQGTKGMYQSIEFGVTANTRESDLVIYLDDILVEKIN